VDFRVTIGRWYHRVRIVFPIEGPDFFDIATAAIGA
jgi:hypothetical protein